MTVCDGYDARSGRQCLRTDTVEVVAACLHEHMGPRDLCPDHVEDLNAGWMRCGDCLNAGCDCRLVSLDRAGQEHCGERAGEPRQRRAYT
jgi:hypothetical protein